MTDITTIHDAQRAAQSRLAARFGDAEATALTRELFGYLFGYTPIDLVLHKDKEISPFMQEKADKVVDRLLAGEPLQYITGTARFFGLDFGVTPAVLIPRPETEELVDMIVNEYGDRPDLRVLDLCTGSGCIALSLARALKFAQVEATDISPEALEVARRNAAALRVRARFKEADLLSLNPDGREWDIIVSNPPYVLESEARDMESVVLDHEPHLALFVPDSDPLRFYRPIARYAAASLAPAGRLYLEINPLECDDLLALLRSEGLHDPEAVIDMTGRRRFIIARSPRHEE